MVDARAILAGTALAGENVVVIGAGEVGMETAEFLADQGKKITLVEILPTIGEEMVRDVFGFVREQLERLGVEVLTSTRVEEITDHGVLVVGADGRKRTLAADTVEMGVPEEVVATLLTDNPRRFFEGPQD